MHNVLGAMGLQTLAAPQVQGAGEAVCEDGAAVRAEAPAVVPQAGCPRVPHALLAHPQTCATPKRSEHNFKAIQQEPYILFLQCMPAILNDIFGIAGAYDRCEDSFASLMS